MPDLALQPLAGGHRNTVLRGRSAGHDVVFKTTRRSAAQLGWLARLREPIRAAGLVAALPVPTLSGAIAAQGWTMEPFVDGRPLMPNELPLLIDAIKGFHLRTRGTPQRPGFLSAKTLVREGAGGDVDLSAMPPALVSLCRSAWSALPDAPLGAIHADLNPSNIVVTPDMRFALLDWDEARADFGVFDVLALGETGDPVARNAALAYEIATCWCIEPKRAQRLAGALSNALG